MAGECGRMLAMNMSAKHIPSLSLAPDIDAGVGEMLAGLEDARFDDGESLVARASLADADLGRRKQERDNARAEARRLAAALAGEGAEPAEVGLPVVVQGGRS